MSFEVSSCFFGFNHFISLFFIFVSSSVLLISEFVSFDFFLFGLVNVLNQNSFVFELITLWSEVKLVIPKYIPNSNNVNYWCLSIFLASLYFLRSLLRTLCLLIHSTLVGILDSWVPLLFPVPVCLPLLFSSKFLLALDREWMVMAFFIIKPSFTNLRMLLPGFNFKITWVGQWNFLVFVGVEPQTVLSAV